MKKSLTALFISSFHPVAPKALVYMLQQVDYSLVEFGDWLDRFPNLTRVMQRQRLVYTPKTKILAALSYGVWFTLVLSILILFLSGRFVEGLLLIIFMPILTPSVLSIAVFVGKLYVLARQGSKVDAAKTKLKVHKTEVIAVLGSYGKTTMKELLATLLSHSKHVAMTPGNKNVLTSQASWVLNSLDSTEDIIIVEFGEYRAGDITAMTKLFEPQTAIITGYAPNHLDSYKTEAALKVDFLSVLQSSRLKNIYVNQQATDALSLPETAEIYSNQQVLGWQISDIHIDFSGTSFTIKRGNQKQRINTKLLGAHLVPATALSVVLANKFDISWKQIHEACEKIVPYEHRMQPRNMNGAWIIDDTYNGNIEGIEAGLQLLQDLPAKRKIYVTPGLVEQGERTNAVHQKIGNLIAHCNPNKVVLMNNSVTPVIEKSLMRAGYKGEILIESNPLQYYQNLELTLAAGDLVLLQNDWTDNYN